MYDYKYGRPTQNLKLAPKTLLSRLALSTHPSPVLVHVFRYIAGHAIAKNCVFVSRQWYMNAAQPDVWQEQCQQIGRPELVKKLFDQLSTKLKNLQKQMKTSDNQPRVREEAECLLVSGGNFSAEDITAAAWRFVYWNLLVKTCLECGQMEGKMRFTTLLQRALCGNCRKLEKYQMTDHIAAERDYGITRKDLNNSSLEGLKISDPAERGKYLFVYYTADLLRLKAAKDHTESLPKPTKASKKPPSLTLQEKAELKLAERRDLIYKTLEDLNITDTDFIADLMEDQNNWVPLYYAGKIRVPRPRMLIRLERCYGKWVAARAGIAPGTTSKRTKTAEAVITSQKIARDKAPTPVVQTAPVVPQKKKRLTEDDFALRKQELIDRLAKMGVPEEKIEFEDPDEGAYKYVHGITDEIGPVAGAIWRKNKPVFTGIGFKTCQREEDLQRLAPKTDYNSD